MDPARPSPRTGRAVLPACAVTAGAGLVALLVLLVQPWASCPGVADGPAGCPVTGTQASVQSAVALLVVVAGTVLAVRLLVPRGRRDGSAPLRWVLAGLTLLVVSGVAVSHGLLPGGAG